MGGIAGLCLTAQTSTPDLNVLGPPECADYFDSAREFFAIHNFTILFPPPSEEGAARYEDATLRVESLELEYRGPQIMPAKSM